MLLFIHRLTGIFVVVVVGLLVLGAAIDGTCRLTSWLVARKRKVRKAREAHVRPQRE